MQASCSHVAVALCFVICLGTLQATGAQFELTDVALRRLLCGGKDDCVSQPFSFETVKKLVKQQLEGYIAAQVLQGKNATQKETPFPYWNFLPEYLGSIKPNEQKTLRTPCFGTLKVQSALAVSSQAVTLSFLPGDATSKDCSENLIIVGGALLDFETLTDVGTQSVVLNVSGTMADSNLYWYYQNSGMKIFTLRESYFDAALDLLSTIDLMAAFGQKPISLSSYLKNFDMMTNYVQATNRMQPKLSARLGGTTVAKLLDPKEIQSGDALFIYRMDGLDSIIGWGEGATAAHSVVAMRSPNGTLFICESNAAGAYWPVNGIQCNSWSQWLEYAEAAQLNVVLLPLSPKYRAMFDANKAWDFYSKWSGYDYGYGTFVFGWLDTFKSNFPCTPPYFNSTCFSQQLAELFFVFQDRLLGNSHYNVARQALNHRTGTWEKDLSLIEIMRLLHSQGRSLQDLYVMPEQDEWMYRTERNGIPAVGKSMVCCVFVCNMWKAAGLFQEVNNSIQCGEQTLWDIFSMKIYDEDKMYVHRPEVCKAVDPDNQFCQVMGGANFHLKPDINSRALYEKMGERCSSQAPLYIREPGC